GSVLAVEDGVDLRKRDALDGDRHLDEVAHLRAEVRDAIEAAHFPKRCRIGEPQLGYGVWPAQVGKVALALDVVRDIDLIQTCEVVVHFETPWLVRLKCKAPRGARYAHTAYSRPRSA